MIALSVQAQVSVDRPIIFNSTDSTLRQVDGMAIPTGNDHGVTMQVAAEGELHWATTVAVVQRTLQVTLEPPLTNYQDGLLIRVASPQEISDTMFLQVDGLAAKEVRRSDQLPPQLGDVGAGQLLQLQFNNDKFYLIGRTSGKCPTGFFKANNTFCIQVDENPETPYYEAYEMCYTKGARLCTWDQYYYGCLQGTGQLNDLFDDWEWMEDTSDHTHTADQAGRWSCVSQRSANAAPNVINSSRCCYQLR